jgi:cell division septation protein DedD
VGEPSRSAERIVPREESPIDQSRIPQGGTADRIPGGTVTAATPQFSPPPQASAPSPQGAAPAPQGAVPTVAPANVSTEPRRVRTVTVRSDGSVVSDPARAAAPATPARPGTGPAASPLALQGGQATAVPPQRPATTTSSAPLQGDNPWSNLSSSGQVGTQASLPQQSAPAPAIAVNTPAPAGSYVVQVAAQKSEAEAQATWQALQQRYGAVLAGQQAQIRRVDLGERGVFYRAQVGPFTSRAQASEVCQSLKAAGGECVIQRN